MSMSDVRRRISMTRQRFALWEDATHLGGQGTVQVQETKDESVQGKRVQYLDV